MAREVSNFKAACWVQSSAKLIEKIVFWGLEIKVSLSKVTILGNRFEETLTVAYAQTSPVS